MKKTQVLDKPPKSTDAISAHSCIASYQGNETRGTSKSGDSGGDVVALFRIERYLRYAHLIPDLASGIVKEFELPLDAADSQTSLLADETSGLSLSKAIACLQKGDKVELEWLQMRIEFETTVDEDRYSIIEQCQKLTALDTEAEKALMEQYKEPQIMIRKDQMDQSVTCEPPPKKREQLAPVSFSRNFLPSK
eukprot:CAMPEP_0195257974 /NCGR_PEP_ID=MMETSP0706-20130129/7123_1 /TAXON_ID=33640 /ORGANISM="Asterionellopsis glacialis, Strain CCMP134" /LENGTH=192 /DNA_ID=CAMNT_0040311255 /DNA_START=248 /DNA_END=826 /DNA_ORIENTATION=+